LATREMLTGNREAKSEFRTKRQVRAPPVRPSRSSEFRPRRHRLRRNPQFLRHPSSAKSVQVQQAPCRQAQVLMIDFWMICNPAAVSCRDRHARQRDRSLPGFCVVRSGAGRVLVPGLSRAVLPRPLSLISPRKANPDSIRHHRSVSRNSNPRSWCRSPPTEKANCSATSSTAAKIGRRDDGNDRSMGCESLSLPVSRDEQR
jgi:hypothetical protein